MEYQQKIIAYIDILGFKNYIERSKSLPSQNLLFKTLFSFKSSEQTNILKFPTRLASHFSDLLVITVDMKTEYVKQLITDLRELSVKIIDSSSLLLRGVIVQGQIIHENGIIFGPGLIEAYEKEKQLAKYPRIIVDESIYQQFELKWSLKHDFDDNRYIDYLSGLISVFEKNPEIGCIRNKNLGRLVKQGLISDDKRIREKYEWIALKHNEIIKGWNYNDTKLMIEI